MTAHPTPTEQHRQRLRLRFRKEGDLRWISHRDLLRVFERLFRRADLPLRMSQGFHPKPKLSFPTALALGVEGWNEVMEFELDRQLDPDMVREQIRSTAPEGLVVTSVEPTDAEGRKARLVSMDYQFPVPSERRSEVQQNIRQLQAGTLPLKIADGRELADAARDDLEMIRLCDGELLQFRIRATRQASVRPRDVLATLNLEDLLEDGQVLVRTSVEYTATRNEPVNETAADPTNMDR